MWSSRCCTNELTKHFFTTFWNVRLHIHNCRILSSFWGIITFTDMKGHKIRSINQTGEWGMWSNEGAHPQHADYCSPFPPPRPFPHSLPTSLQPSCDQKLHIFTKHKGTYCVSPLTCSCPSISKFLASWPINTNFAQWILMLFLNNCHTVLLFV